MSEEGNRRGKSASAKRRHYLMDSDPEMYEDIRRQRREREQRRRQQLREHWGTGTRAAEMDREAFLAKRREISRQIRALKKAESWCQTRASLVATPPQPCAYLKGLTPEQKRDLRNARRREIYASKSKQKSIADRKKSATKMREYRQRKKALLAERRTVSQTTPIICDNSVSKESSQLMRTPVKGKRMRQHCYNTVSKVKSTLRQFQAEEAAAMTINLMLTRTPEKRRRNLDKHFKRLGAARKKIINKMLPKSGHKETARYVAKSAKLRRSRYALVKQDIKKFYLRPDISRIFPHGP